MERDATPSTLELSDAETATPTAPRVIEADAIEFVSNLGLQRDFDAALDRIEEIFEPEKITVELIPSVENNYPDGYALAFNVKCELDIETFNARCDSFYGPYEKAKPSIFFYMCVMRDFEGME